VGEGKLAYAGVEGKERSRGTRVTPEHASWSRKAGVRKERVKEISMAGRKKKKKRIEEQTSNK